MAKDEKKEEEKDEKDDKKNDKKEKEKDKKEDKDAAAEKDGEGEGAEGEEGAEGAEGGEAKPKLSKKKLMIIGGAALVVLLGAGAGAFFMLKSPPPPVEGEEGAEGAEGEHGKPKAPEIVYYDLPAIMVNLNTGGKQTSFIKATVTLELANADAKSEIEAVLPRVMDNFNTYLREMRATDLQGSAGVYRLREELLIRINKYVGPGRVNDVLFKEILVQ